MALCIIAGIVLGQLLPAPFQVLGRMNMAEVNIPVAVLIVPMLLKVDFGAFHQVAGQWRGIAVTVGINWLIKPFSMALLGWLFIGWLFRPWLPAGQIDSYIAGLILLAAAPCTAMVFVWSNLTDGDPNLTLSQVALNGRIATITVRIPAVPPRPRETLQATIHIAANGNQRFTVRRSCGAVLCWRETERRRWRRPCGLCSRSR